MAWAGHINPSKAELGDNARMLQREKPGSLRSGRGKKDLALSRGRAECCPAIVHPELPAKAVLPGGFLAFLPDDE
ncbi:hypothetical protein [Bradyrhizobium ottawaense]|uniref:hypothetical protein n=1 Tax=Bradyrhizobium ottawaense TaxID=931866 RepID=UPI0035167A29